jgi:hypothetical protein|uniref:Uncharacterized protein n=1 Tax=viral metagenome TaxID=1070528 RepID=A0A6C0DJ81_9ZZZZ
MSNFPGQQRYLTRSFQPDQQIRTPEPGTNPLFRKNANATYITRPNEGDNSMTTVYKKTPSNMNYNNMDNWKLSGGIHRKSRKSRKSGGKSRKLRKSGRKLRKSGGKSRKSRKSTRK